ncbi:MAG: tRNA uridine-5-carboxymethylaminomethyl(34) synthesis enzyme MnmG [Rhodobacteraceae bacterium]|nr:tRNA uridine-5-carboxymethylaminomethyl(34) synthesis enzyme MnmG [Paracoccaceae bacterium]
MFHVKHFDVLVVGGGHAGTEAAHAAARRGARVALVTLKASAIGVMSCNPAIGGLGKGHLVREIDALDGLMGKAADRAGIQFRLLNRSKGPAVQGPRAQMDRGLYRAAIQSMISDHPWITVIEGEVVDFVLQGHRVGGVLLASGDRLTASATVLTTGTFLRGTIHIGTERRSGGRMGEDSAGRLSARFADFGVSLGRLKTGTPPRLDSASIDWTVLDMQAGDYQPEMLSFLSDAPSARQISCGITHTNERTHQIIRDNLARSAMYGGEIDGVGPRYCPSIEDKVVRFADRDAHQVFLEPEGLDVPSVYPNGISTSLPQDVQVDYVRSIKGLESAEILQPGYAIEYDYVDPRNLAPSLELPAAENLFLAGQINGTTGYEEAGAQGLVAGLNAAARAYGRDLAILDRTTSYTGVMLDDLTTRGVSEPYRMFTSRAEFRLSLRADNADQRLTPLGQQLGCVSDTRARFFEAKQSALDSARALLESQMISAPDLKTTGINVNSDGPKRSLFDALSIPGASVAALAQAVPDLAAMDPEIARQLHRDATYAPYVKRQMADVAELTRDSMTLIPGDFSYVSLDGLSGELREKLAAIRPANLAQAARIEGMTPAALTLLLARLRQDEKSVRSA